MSLTRILSIVVFVLGVAAAVYYTAEDKEAQGAVVVLTAILFFLALPYLRGINTD